MPKVNHSYTKKDKRKIRTRKKLFGSLNKPRVSVFRSNQHFSAQAINDEKQITISAVTTIGKKKSKTKLTKTAKAVEIAKNLATLLKKNKVKTIVFDRGYYKYHGRVKAFADSLREEGINF